MMGCFNVNCCLTGTSIEPGVETYLFPIIREEISYSSHNLTDPPILKWIFAGLPIKAYYNDYGRFTLDHNRHSKRINVLNMHEPTEEDNLFSNEEITEMCGIPNHDGKFIHFFTVRKSVIDRLIEQPNKIWKKNTEYLLSSLEKSIRAEPFELYMTYRESPLFFDNTGFTHKYSDINKFAIIYFLKKIRTESGINEDEMRYLLDIAKICMTVSIYVYNAHIPIVPCEDDGQGALSNYYRHFLHKAVESAGDYKSLDYDRDLDDPVTMKKFVNSVNRSEWV
jgi:hypothetical protein